MDAVVVLGCVVLPALDDDFVERDARLLHNPVEDFLEWHAWNLEVAGGVVV
jgi:hypothetical protein